MQIDEANQPKTKLCAHWRSCDHVFINSVVHIAEFQLHSG